MTGSTLKHLLHRVLQPAAAALAIGLVTACGGGGDDLDDRLNLAEPQLRMVHAAPVAPSLTLYRNGAKDTDADNVGYRHASNYHDITFGANALSLRVASTDTEIASGNIDAQRGRKYTAVALPDNISATLMLIDDPYERSLTTNRARLRVVNAAVNAQNIDVYITAPNADLTALNPTFAALGYRQAQPASGSNATELDPGTYQLRLTPAGSKTPFFITTVTVAEKVDWLLITVPSDGVGLTNPNQVKVLRVQSDDASQTALEINSD